jgi:hypothetical protein
MSVRQLEPVEDDLVEDLVNEVREIREEVSGPSYAQVLRRGLLIGGVAGLVWSQRYRIGYGIARRATGRILTAFE